MVRAEVITLIPQEERGVFEASTEQGKKVFCSIQSVRMSEFYRAKNEGIEPEFIFVLPYYRDYNDEQFVDYKGVRYRIVRSYVDGMKCELTVERVDK